MIKLPRHEVEDGVRPRFDTEESQASYTRPRPGITPAHAGFVGSWGMSQQLQSMGHLETINGKTTVILHSTEGK
jgi:hypothetical protein